MVTQKPRTRHLRRSAVAVVMSAGLAMGLASCGFNAQTLQPYTPAEGVNANIGENPDTSMPLVKVRNLMVISKTDGEGFVSGQLTSDEGDTLTGMTAVALGADASPSGDLTVDFPGDVEVKPHEAVQLSDTVHIKVTGDELVSGFTAEITLTFEKAGETKVIVPLVDGNKPDFKTVQPPQ